jgi:hypothetical protein
VNTHPRTYLVLLSYCAAACLLAACATTESLRASASRLDDASKDFSSLLQYQGDDGRRDRGSRDAAAMAKAAHNLDVALDKGNSRDDVEAEYRQVTDRYDQLHSQLADEGYAEQNRRVLEEFDRVTAAYRNVEAAMNGRSTNARDSKRD